MGLPLLPTAGLDDVNLIRRVRELINAILTFTFDDSRIRTPAEVAAGVTPINYAYPPYHAWRYLTAAQITDVIAGTALVDCTAGLQNWLDASAGKTAFLPKGTYLISSQLNASNATYIRGDGREASYLKYTGTTTITGGAMLKFATRSAFRVSSIGFRATGLVVGNTTIALHLENCVYGKVDNISIGGSGASSGTNNLRGILIDQTTSGFVPPRGSIEVSHVLYVVEPTDSGASSSRAIHVKGHASQKMEFVTLIGEGNLEHAYYGVHFENTANCSIYQWQMRGATNTEIVLTNSDNTMIVAPMLAPAPTTGTGISVDSNSFDTLIFRPGWNFSSGAPLASLVDNGVRTSVIVPGVAGALPVRGKHSGSLVVTEHDSTTSQNGTLEALKDPSYDRNALVVRDASVAPTGTKAYLKIERGGDARALIQCDINGTNHFGVTSAGRTVAATQMQIPVVATASLPAAGAAQDGLILIEDAGAGDRNVIIYAGGQRFRLDGGSAV